MDPKQILAEGIAAGLHPGAQLFVLVEGKCIIDFVCGEASTGVAMQTNSIVQWYSAGKPLTAVLIAQLYERGEFQLDDRVSRFIPEFATGGKDEVTLFHLLTHTAGIRDSDTFPRASTWDAVIQRICETPLEKDWILGKSAGYSTQAGWFILAEIIQRITKESYDSFIKSELLEPLGMGDSWLRLPVAQYKEYGTRIAVMYNTAGGKRDVLPLQDAEGMAICRPGGSARGPVRELARFYQMLLNKGELEGHRCLKPETIELFTSPHRVGLFDLTFMHILDYGLGFILNSNRYGAETVPYGYGRYASDESFGHSGAQSSCAFADPKHQLVVSWAANGLPGERDHQKRQRELNSAIYQSLGLA